VSFNLPKEKRHQMTLVSYVKNAIIKKMNLRKVQRTYLQEQGKITNQLSGE
jgi:hypothetical protein